MPVTHDLSEVIKALDMTEPPMKQPIQKCSEQNLPLQPSIRMDLSLLLPQACVLQVSFNKVN
jgi:hypothetical protein